MPILQAEIQIPGHAAKFVAGSFSFLQITDYKGRPSTDVRLGLIELTMVGPEAIMGIWDEWMLDSYRRISGNLFFFEKQGQVAKRVVFYDAYCVYYQCRFDARGYDGKGSYEVEINLSAAAEEVDGQYSEAHSLIPWVTDSATSYRALTKPPDYMPTKALAATGVAAAPTFAAAADKTPLSMLAAAKPVAPNYRTLEMHPRYNGEETGAVWGSAVKYLSATERQKFLLTVDKDGLLRNAEKALFDTANSKTSTDVGRSIFVMDEKGNIYASPYQERGEFHHSSFLAGEAVAAAGELIAEQGVITQASNGSGHYQPDHSFTHQFVDQLRLKGAKNVDKITVVDFNH